jgi:hypothetical protein
MDDGFHVEASSQPGVDAYFSLNAAVANGQGKPSKKEKRSTAVWLVGLSESTRTTETLE